MEVRFKLRPSGYKWCNYDIDVAKLELKWVARGAVVERCN